MMPTPEAIPTPDAISTTDAMPTVDQHLANQIGHLAPISDALRQCICDAHEALRNGNTVYRCPQPLVGEVTKLLEQNPDVPLTLVAGDYLAFKRPASFEKIIATAFTNSDVVVDDEAIEQAVSYLSLAFDLSSSKEQHQALAIANALHYQHSIITGGPGTGKTATVARLVATLAQFTNHVRLLLLAPTGKAAQRLEQSFSRSFSDLSNADNVQVIGSSTIHRLLFNKAQADIANIIVVDEASMVDIALAARLITTLPSDAKIIWLGDADQLVSVGAGAVMADLTQASWPPNQPATVQAINQITKTTPLINGPVARLQGSFRSQQHILQLAEAINTADQQGALETISQSEQLSCQSVYEFLEQPFAKAIKHFSELAQQSSADSAMSQLSRYQILCPTRHGELGTDEINARFRRELGGDDEALYQGMPVLITENSYDVGLFNGDLGLLWLHAGQLLAYFETDQGLKSLPVNQIPAWLPAYALTIHKTQGSEYDQVAVVSEELYMPLNRALLYTAVTRAKQRCALFIGDASLDNTMTITESRDTALGLFLATT